MDSAALIIVMAIILVGTILYAMAYIFQAIKSFVMSTWEGIL